MVAYVHTYSRHSNFTAWGIHRGAYENMGVAWRLCTNAFGLEAEKDSGHMENGTHYPDTMTDLDCNRQATAALGAYGHDADIVIISVISVIG